MASVTFSTTVGGDGSTVSDDTSPTTGLRNGGYLTRFVPALQQVVAVAGFVLAQATAASGSATAASASASAASMSASNAAASASSAAAAYDAFDDRWLGAKSADPTVDNDGNPLLLGAVYWNTTASETRVWTGTIWQTATINGGTIANLNVTGNTTLGDAGTDTLTVNAAATFAGSLAYTGTLTGGAGVINIGSGQIYKDAAGNVVIGGTTPIGTTALSVSKQTSTIAAFFDTSANASGIGGGVLFGGTYDTGLTTSWASVRGSKANGTAGNFAGRLVFQTRANGAALSDNMTLDEAGNLGLGVTPISWGPAYKAFQFGPAGSLFSSTIANLALSSNVYYDASNTARYINTNFATTYRQNDGAGNHTWSTAPSGIAGNPVTLNQVMMLTQGGNLSLTQTRAYNASADIYFEIGGTDNGYVNAGAVSSWRQSVAGNANGQALRFEGYLRGTGWSEFARITSGGYVQASNTGGYGGVAGVGGISGNSYHIFQSNANSETVLVINGNTGSTVSNFASYLATGAAGFHMQGYVNASVVYKVLANGNVQNANNSYGAISDAKLKNIIAPRDGAHYWEKFKLIKFWIYSLISDPTNQQLLGVVAQELRNVFPGLVIETPDMHEVTKTRTVTTTRQVTEPVEQQQVKTEVVLENGRYVQKTTVEIVTLDEPVFDEYPLYDENGDRVMTLVSPEVEEQLDEGGNVIVEAQLPLYEPATHKVPRTETVESVEEYTEMEPTGEVTLAVNYSILGLIADTITQELQRRMESAEQRLDLLEAA